MNIATPTWTEDLDSRTNVYVRQWMRHFPLLRATSIDAWLERFEEHTLPTRVRRLTASERDLLVEDHWRRLTDRPMLDGEATAALNLDLEELIAWAQERSEDGAAFVRLGFRAPVDSELGLDGDLQVDSGLEALEVLQSSARMFDDLCLAQECGHSPAVVVRPWLAVEPWQELRAFVKSRRLVGLSQRHVGARLPGLVERVDDLEEAAQRLCGELAGSWPLDDLVVDLLAARDEGPTRVVDLHPWLPWTDAALFDWEADAFAAYEFRYRQ